jgi:hypothetical protein
MRAIGGRFPVLRRSVSNGVATVLVGSLTASPTRLIPKSIPRVLNGDSERLERGGEIGAF